MRIAGLLRTRMFKYRITERTYLQCRGITVDTSILRTQHHTTSENGTLPMTNTKQTLANIKEMVDNDSKSLRDTVLHLRFESSNGCRFGVDGHERDGFIVFEMLPIGIVALRGSLDTYMWSKHDDAMSDPNGYQAALEDDGIDPAAMIYMRGGSSPRDSIRPTLRDAVSAVDNSIRDNVFLSDKAQGLGKLIPQKMTSHAPTAAL